MSNLTAQNYIKLFADNEKAKLSFLACAAALRLDDEVARNIIQLVAQSNGSTDELLLSVKSLGCVWKQWDGSWYIAEDVRPYLLDRFYSDVPNETCQRLREYLASQAELRAEELSPDGQITAYQARQARFEAAYHRTLIPEQAQEGGKQFTALWQNSPRSAARATAEAVDYLARAELHRRLSHLPSEVLFLQGMAARARHDKRGQERYFGAVWTRQGGDDIFSIAAHLYGVLVRNRKTAEQALRDSIAARKDPADRGQVWHSLGNLLSKDPQRRSEAEEAYLESLAYTDDDPASRGERLHSYGNFLAEDSTRWSEAERAYQESLDLLVSKGDKAQTLADWSRLLARFDTAQGSSRAEEYALKGLKLDPKNPKTSGICYQILADIYEARGDNNKAIWALKGVIETDRRQGKKQYEKELQNKLAELRQPAQEQVDNPDID